MFPRTILFICFFFNLAVVGYMASTPGPSPAIAAGNSTEFIRAHCSVTRYQELCFRSLSRYAGKIQQSPYKLAGVATNVTLGRLRSLSRRVAALRRDAAVGKKEASALEDCAETLGDATNLARRTAGELWELETAAGTEVAWGVSNAQTWMSAALTNEDTCSEGFDGVSSWSTVKDEIIRRVERVEQYTSNALAIVNSLVVSSR